MFENIIKRAEAIIEALPYLRRYWGKILVIKYGGRVLTDPEIGKKMIEDIVLLKYAGMHPVLVHGGGPEITRLVEKKDIRSKFIEGMRVTTPEIMKVVESVLGRFNAKLVSGIKSKGMKATGFIGRKGRLLSVKKYFVKTSKGLVLDLGLTGKVSSVKKSALLKAIHGGAIPVITSIGIGPGGKHFNVNADSAAAAVAGALKASKLILLTDVRGVLGHDGRLMSIVSSDKVNGLIKSGVITGGMIPKVRCAQEALKNGVEKVHIIEGKIPRALLLEVFTDSGIGTMVVK
jgi:acetylglutamate kinase